MLTIHKKPIMYYPPNGAYWQRKKANWEIRLENGKIIVGAFHYKSPNTIKIADYYSADRIVFRDSKFLFQSRKGSEWELDEGKIQEILAEKSTDFRSQYFCDLIEEYVPDWSRKMLEEDEMSMNKKLNR